jgi:hypothetical protein
MMMTLVIALIMMFIHIRLRFTSQNISLGFEFVLVSFRHSSELLRRLLTGVSMELSAWEANSCSATPTYSQHLTETEGPSPCSQKPANNFCPEPGESSSDSHLVSLGFILSRERM